MTIIVIIGIIIIVIWFYNKNQSLTSDTNSENFNESYSQAKFSEKEIDYNYHKNYFLNNKIGYFSQAHDNEMALFISRLVAPDGTKSSWAKFRNQVVSIIPYYDIDVLKKEFNSFYSMAQSYQSWQNIQKDKDILPFLKYDAVSDGLTCKTCKKLHNITRPVDDPFWDIYFPPNCDSCRCCIASVGTYERVKITDLSKKLLIVPNEKFAINVGKHELKLSYINSNLQPVQSNKTNHISNVSKTADTNYKHQTIQSVGLQVLETMNIIATSKAMDTIKGRYDFLLSIIDTLKNGHGDSRYLSDIQIPIDNYKTLYYDRVIKDYELSILLKPNDFDLNDFYCKALFGAFQLNHEKHIVEIKGLKRQDAKVRRIEKIKELIKYTKEELNLNCSSTSTYSLAYKKIEEIESSLNSIDFA